VDAVEDHVEFEILVGLPQAGGQFLEAQENPAVQILELGIRDPVFLRVEIIQVPQEEPQVLRILR